MSVRGSVTADCLASYSKIVETARRIERSECALNRAVPTAALATFRRRGVQAALIAARSARAACTASRRHNRAGLPIGSQSDEAWFFARVSARNPRVARREHQAPNDLRFVGVGSQAIIGASTPVPVTGRAQFCPRPLPVHDGAPRAEIRSANHFELHAGQRVMFFE